MTETVIRLFDQRQWQTAEHSLPIPATLEAPQGLVRDARGRALHDLRISVTDRCNFRCVYCMPKEVFDKDYRFLPHKQLLSFEEITRVARLFVAHGVEKIRLTGGEPLLRKDLPQLVSMLADLRTPDGRELDLTLTTNASILAQKAQALKDAGLRRLTVSLDALSDAKFKRMNDVDFAVDDVLRGLEQAHAVGLGPIKVNMVVKRGMNEDEIVPMARYFKNTPFILRFIEYMDVGSSNGWQMQEVVSAAEIVEKIAASAADMGLQALPPSQLGETANRWRYQDGSNEIGVIASVTRAFCSDCNRIRLSTEGKLYTCLFAASGHDLRSLLRNGASDAEISSALAGLWRVRNDRYSELRAADGQRRDKIEMSYIGG